MNSVLEQLEAMRRLPENWDGYAAAAPQVQAIDLAWELAAILEVFLGRQDGEEHHLHVTPTRVGGVLIEWQHKHFEHEVDINPDGSISFLHRDQTTGAIHSHQFTPEPGVVQAGFLHQLRELLAA